MPSEPRPQRRERLVQVAPAIVGAIDALRARIDRLERGARMAPVEDDPRRRQALAGLKEAVGTLDTSTAQVRASIEEQERLLERFRAAVKLADELLELLEHHVRGPLTVIKGRAQLLRRQAVEAPQPDLRIISGLNEIDTAVDRIVLQLDRLLRDPLKIDQVGRSGQESNPP
jgi:signal transduction histidine kinase